MGFGPIMRFSVGELRVELAPLTKSVMGEFTDITHGGGMQQHSVGRYLGLTAAPVHEDEEEWYERTRLAKDTLLWGIWLLEGEGESQKRVLIGTSGLHGITGGHSGHMRQATSGSLIFRKEYWGKGIASAAHKARTWYAFQHMGLHRIKSAVLQANGGSRKALERSGYIFVYTERNERYGDGEFHHLDNLECLNPLGDFWLQWWHGDRPSTAHRTARQLTLAAMAWAKENVELS